jgi:hypothetical protein
METKKGLQSTTVACVLVLMLSAVGWSEDPVYFADPILKRLVEVSVRIADPTATDMLGLTKLVAGNCGITDLTGLEGATNLQMLLLRVNRIRDLSPLAGLVNLQQLLISENQVADLSPLAGLTSLQYLDFHHNQVSDLTPLADLANLQQLILYNNQVSDLSPLLGLTKLRVLELGENPLNEEAYNSHLQTISDNMPRGWPMYSPNRRPPGGVAASKGLWPDRVQITWEPVRNGLASGGSSMHYQVSRAVSADGPPNFISDWQTSQSLDDVTAESGTKYVYRVRTASSSQGDTAGDWGQPDVGWIPGPPSLDVSAGPGGRVTLPGEGVHAAAVGQTVPVQAEPADANLYVFAGWSGTAVDTNLVADPENPSTTAIVDNARSVLKANFLSRLHTIYVDNDAASDPGPCDGANRDPRENGTRAHPFDTIQEAIDVAAEGATIRVRPGTYHECIEFVGRNVAVTGFDPNRARGAESLPVIDANYAGVAATFRRGEDPTCVLAGFVITRGKGDVAGALCCMASSPTISNCLIVGNRATNMAGAAIYCAESQAGFTNCTIADNAAGAQGAGIHMAYCSIVFVNSIVWGNAPRDTFAGGRSNGGSLPRMTFSDMADPTFNKGNIETDPLFVRPGWWADRNDLNQVAGSATADAVWVMGDYHLKSEAGRWDPVRGSWVLDDVTSPCIDAGDPSSPVGDEPEPNGGRINMGTYGGTAEAGKSP